VDSPHRTSSPHGSWLEDPNDSSEGTTTDFGNARTYEATDLVKLSSVSSKTTSTGSMKHTARFRTEWTLHIALPCRLYSPHGSWLEDPNDSSEGTTTDFGNARTYEATDFAMPQRRGFPLPSHPPWTLNPMDITGFMPSLCPYRVCFQILLTARIMVGRSQRFE
jgi:hypothetical protein